MSTYKLPKGRALVLRTCNADLTSHKGFQWPDSGEVSAPDWKDNAECGNGLHGWLWGQGDFRLKSDAPDRKWLVVEVAASSVVNLGGKVKFPKCKVLFVGFWWDAMALIRRHRAKAEKLEAFATGNYSHAAATGDSGHAAATGYSGHAAATGNYSHAAATGDSSHAAATGYSSHAAATGNSGHAAATGNYSHAAAMGDSSHAAATGNYGHAAATGDSSHAAATGYSGHAAATGDSGIACALGKGGSVKAGEKGALVATWHDGDRFRIIVGYVGEDGILANQSYFVRDGKLTLT